MDSKHIAFPFRWILPLSQLVLCLLILWPDRYYVIAELGGPKLIESLYQMQHSSRPIHVNETKATKSDSKDETDDTINLVLPPDAEIEREIRRTEIRLATTASLNFPAALVELPFAALSPSGREWAPHNMDLKVWNATVWPLAGMVFWWVAGRGMKALVAVKRKLIAPRLRWIEVIVAAIVFAGGGVALVAWLTAPALDREWPTDLLAFGGLLWMALTAIAITARIAQWRIRKAMGRMSGAAPRPG